MSAYYTLVTDAGNAKLAAALATGTSVTLKEVAVGDGGGAEYEPDGGQTALKNEVYRTAINAILTDKDHPDWLVVEALIPAEKGGWAVREVGVFDTDGAMIAIAKFPESVKPVLADGVGKDLYLRIILEYANAAVTLKIDPSIVLSTRAFVDDNLEKHAKGTLYPHPDASETDKGLIELATEAEAKAGANAAKAITPKTMIAAVVQWLDARFGAGAPSAFVKELLTATGAEIVRAALELKSAALEEASSFAAAVHTHVIADVAGLADALAAKLAAASYTTADVLSKLLAVDGAGSGLDADTIDGQHANAFVSASVLGPYIPNIVGGIPDDCNTCLPGAYTLVSTSANHPGNGYGVIACRRGGTRSNTPDGSMSSFFSQTAYTTDQNVHVRFNTNSDPETGWGDWYKLWHTGNDGSGSGLDADTLDGKKASNFLPNNGSWYSNFDAHEFVRQYGIEIADGGICFMTNNGQMHVLIDGSYHSGENGGYYSGSGYGAEWGFYGQNGVVYFNTGSIVANGNTVWHAGNDGSGSGLDADTVDGNHASAFARVVASSNSASGGYRVWSDGFKECWGRVSAATTWMTVTYPITFGSWSLAACDAGRTGDARVPFVSATSTTYLTLYNPSDGGLATTWHAWGY